MSQSPANAAAESLIAAALAFLRGYPPFSEMEDAALRFAAARLMLAYYPKGATLFSPAHGAPRVFHVIQRGRVQRVDGDPQRNPPVVTLQTGECFPVGALVEAGPGESTYVAVADTFCYQLPAADFAELLRLSPRFHDFATRHLAALLRESGRLLAIHTASLAWEQQAMNRALRTLIRRGPVCCAPDAPVIEALKAIAEARVGSILVVDPDGRLSGILTRHDVVDRFALAGCDTAAPISSLMTPQPRTLDADASAYDAILLIAREGIRHIPVMDGGRPIGVVTERDLFALQRVSVRGIHRTIADADDAAALRHAARDIRSLARDLLVQGLAAEQLTLIISTLNDALTRRIIEIEAPRHPVAGIRWCWLAFGSEGRYEQTISTDQDNGLLFVPGPGQSADDARASLLPFGRAVNATLDACGFPLCKGGIMAGNPRCCLSLDEWQQRFADWIRNPAEQELLDAAIFFDFRILHGDTGLADTLRATLTNLGASRPAFLQGLARQAIGTRPPLGLLRNFDTDDDDPDAPETLDLKKSGARLFVDAVRVLSLAAGIPHTATAQRLRHAGPRLGMEPGEIAAAVEAFFFIQTLRLRHQLLSGGQHGTASPNRIDPEVLNDVDRRILKESFIQARKLQDRLALDYQL